MFFSLSKTEGAVAHRPLNASDGALTLRKGVPLFPEGAHAVSTAHSDPVVVHRDIMGVLTAEGNVRLYNVNSNASFAEVPPANTSGQPIKDFYFSPLTRTSG